MYFLPRVSTAREESAGQRGGEGGRSGSESEIVGGGEQSRPQVPQVLGRSVADDVRQWFSTSYRSAVFSAAAGARPGAGRRRA